MVNFALSNRRIQICEEVFVAKYSKIKTKIKKHIILQFALLFHSFTCEIRNSRKLVKIRLKNRKTKIEAEFPDGKW